MKPAAPVTPTPLIWPVSAAFLAAVTAQPGLHRGDHLVLPGLLGLVAVIVLPLVVGAEAA